MTKEQFAQLENIAQKYGTKSDGTFQKAIASFINTNKISTTDTDLINQLKRFGFADSNGKVNEKWNSAFPKTQPQNTQSTQPQNTQSTQPQNTTTYKSQIGGNDFKKEDLDVMEKLYNNILNDPNAPDKSGAKNGLAVINAIRNGTKLPNHEAVEATLARAIQDYHNGTGAAGNVNLTDEQKQRLAADQLKADAQTGAKTRISGAQNAADAQNDAIGVINDALPEGVKKNKQNVGVSEFGTLVNKEDGTANGGEGNGETASGTKPQIAGTNGNPSETTKPKEKEANSNGLLLADILMTGVKNALHYRPAFRTAYGEDIEGRDFGNEKSLAMKLAEENMKRGLERRNGRLDYEAQQQAEIEATKQKGQDAKYLAAQQALTRNISPTTTQKSYDESSSNVLTSQRKAGSETNVEWANPNTLAQNVQSSR